MNIKDWVLKNQIENKMKLLDTLSKVEQEVDVSKKVKMVCAYLLKIMKCVSHTKNVKTEVANVAVTTVAMQNILTLY